MSEIVKQEVEQVVYKPKLEQKKAVSFIWVLPLIILCVLGWIAYESYMQKGTNITVIFKSAEGLKEGVTPLEYKGLQLGKVTEISMHDLPDYLHHEKQLPKQGVTLKDKVLAYEYELIVEALNIHGSTRATAEALGVEQSTLVKKITRFKQ